MAGSLNSGIQSMTNEARSLNQNQQSDHTMIDVAIVPNDASHRSASRKMTRIKWTLLLGSFTLEGLSLAFDLLSTPKRPIYAFMSMIVASLGLLISIIEVSFRVRENDMISSRLLGDALENFGFFGSTWQCIYALLQYIYLYEKKINNPIKISVLPLIFLICVTISKLYNNYRGDSSTQRHSYIGAESSMDASRTTTTLSRVDEASVSLSNARAIKDTEPEVQDDLGVPIDTKELRKGTTVHRRIRTGWSDIASQLPGRTDNEIKKYWYAKLEERMKQQKTITLDNDTSRTQQPTNIHGDPPNPATPGIGGSIPSSSLQKKTSEVSSEVTADTIYANVDQ